MICRVLPLAAALCAVAACGKSRDDRAAAPTPAATATTAVAPTIDAGAPDPAARARALAHRLVIADGHIDVPYRLEQSRRPDGSLGEDVAQATEQGDFDYPRAALGGLDAPFMSIYVPAELQNKAGASRKEADRLIDLVDGIIAAAPDKFAAARSPDDVIANHAAGKISLPMGMENGSPVEHDLASVAYFHDRGIRYITLAHSKDNQLADSSYDTHHTWKGLSPFGKKVVAEMNRVGIMVDVAHVSDAAFAQAVALSAVPVIASHSSARHFTPGFERNPSDELIRALADKGGVIMVNFGSGFLRDDSRKSFDAMREASKAFAKQHTLDDHAPEVDAFLTSYQKDHPPVFATVADVADHIDYLVKLVGIDHVGLGSDFDGVRDSLPVGLKDVSMYPNLLRELLARGYSEADLDKICSANLLRVWRAVEAYAAAQAGSPAPAAP
jgi:membrane dipeptidase